MSTNSGKTSASTTTTTTKSDDTPTPVPEPITRFSKSEETRLLAESSTLRQKGNTAFTSNSLQDAKDSYNAALESCPNYLFYEIAIIQSNISACHLKAEEWKDAIVLAGKALDNLEKVVRVPEVPKVEEIDDAEDDEEVAKPPSKDSTAEDGEEEAEERTYQYADIDRLRSKALLRRARARLRSGGWMDLTGAQEDYTLLSKPPLSGLLPDADRKSVVRELRELTPKIEAAKEKETAEMMGKLKDLGNGILKPFGLSTDSFQFVKDEKTGGYSMQFNNGDSK